MGRIKERRTKIVPEMAGRQARWYARQRGTASQLAIVRARAAELADALSAGADVLEVAPGPGYLSVELARRGCRVSAVDISRTFVEIVAENAHAAGVAVDVRHGDVADLPFPAGSFDAVVCQAAFKNFTQPIRALNELYRVLRPGGTAFVDDMRADSTRADIAHEVAGMNLSPLNARWTRMALGWLRRRAYTTSSFTALAARSAFRTATIEPDGIGLRITLTRATGPNA